MEVQPVLHPDTSCNREQVATAMAYDVNMDSEESLDSMDYAETDDLLMKNNAADNGGVGDKDSIGGMEMQDIVQGDMYTDNQRLQLLQAESQLNRAAMFYMLAAAVMAALGGVLFGYDVGIISGALLQLKTQFHLGCLQRELVVSSMLAGALVASVCGGFLVDFIGRRLSIIINAVIFIAGALLLTFSQTYIMLVCGRLILGFAVSLSAIGETVYISEIAPAKTRGMLVSLNELGITAGFLLAYLVAYLFIDIHEGWRFMFGLSICAAVVQGVGMVFLPPSPRYLMIKKQEEKAKLSLQKLRGAATVEGELNAIRSSVQSEKQHSMKELCAGAGNMRSRLLIGMGLVFCQQITGQPNVLYYAPTIFQAIGFATDASATLATVGIGIIKLIFTVVALLCVDRAGRRKFLLGGTFMMLVGILSLGIITRTSPVPMRTPCLTDNALYTYNKIQHHNKSESTSTPVTGANLHSDFFTTNAVSLHRISEQTEVMNSSSYTSSTSRHSRLVTSAPSMMTATLSMNISNGKHLNSTTNGTRAALSDGAKWVAFVALMVYVAGYAVGFGPVSWLILSEIYPSTIRGRAISIATIFNWGTNLVVSLTFLNVMGAMGVSTTFLLYAFICAGSIGFIFLIVPETKGKTLEQISADLKAGSTLGRMLANCQICPCFSRSSNPVVTDLDGRYEEVCGHSLTGPHGLYGESLQVSDI